MIAAKSLPVGVLRQVLGELNGPNGNTDAVVDWLISESLFDATHLRAWAVRRAVDELVAKGHGKVAAMEEVADRMALSFFTVRKYLYTTYK